jgi:hypothetical protein
MAGGCLCGAVRFRLTAAPVATRYCWCRTCQYIAAGNASVNVVVPTDALAVEGATAEFQNTADSGNGMRRRFCAACGTHLFSNSQGRPHLTVVRAGAFDSADYPQPAAAIWVSSAPRWACIADDLEQFPAQPPPA